MHAAKVVVHTVECNGHFKLTPTSLGKIVLKMELAIRIQIEELPERIYLATSDELPGFVSQGRTIAEALDIARDVARKLIEPAANGGAESRCPPPQIVATTRSW